MKKKVSDIPDTSMMTKAIIKDEYEAKKEKALSYDDFRPIEVCATYKVKAAKLHEAVRVGTINRGWVEASDKISLEYNPSHQVLIIRGKGIQNEAWGTGKTIQVQVPVTNVPFMVIAED